MIDLSLPQYNQPQNVPTKAERPRCVDLLKSIRDPVLGRWWAAGDAAISDLTAFIRAVETMLQAAPTEKDLRALLVRIADIARLRAMRGGRIILDSPGIANVSLVQAWKISAIAPPMPEPWRNSMDSTQLPNPYITNDRKGQSVLMQADPALAAMYRKYAADPYGTELELRVAAAKRKEIAQISYSGEIDHPVNVYRANDPLASEKQGHFRLVHGELVSKVFQWESAEVTLSWGASNKNRSANSDAIKGLNEPPTTIVSGDIILLAEHYSKAILKAEREAAQEAAEAATARAQQLRGLPFGGDGVTK